MRVDKIFRALRSIVERPDNGVSLFLSFPAKITSQSVQFSLLNL